MNTLNAANVGNGERQGEIAEAPADTVSSPQELSQEELAEQLDDYSDRISTQIRTVNFGVLGLTWLLLVPKSDAHVQIVISRRPLISIALLCILAILTEFCQYLLAEKTVDETFERARVSSDGKAAYDADAMTYRLQMVCYRIKLYLTLGAAGSLVFFLGKALLS